MIKKLLSCPRLIVVLALSTMLCFDPASVSADDIIWQNIEVMPDDLTQTGDAWTAVRCDDFGNQSYRIACDDFELAQRTRITAIVYYAVGFGPSNLDGHDWYIYEYGSGDLPGKLIASESGANPNRQDTGWVNTVFDTPIFKNTINPTDLVLDPGRYFIAFRSAACLTDGKYSILSTRWATGSARALWNFGVLADGTVTDRWMSMKEFNGITDQEWAFILEGAAVSNGLTLAEPAPGRAGELNRFDAANATPTNWVYFAASLNQGSTSVPGCPGVVLNLARAKVFGRARADANGQASINRFVPNQARGRAIYLQAVEPATCAVSNLLEVVFK